MVPCRQCGQSNPIANKFCSQCGWTMEAEDIQNLEAQITKDITEGQTLFGAGRITEALAVAQTILILDPENVPGLALKGDCQERLGDIAGAFATYETVVNLKPDSPLDRIRLAQLKKQLHAPTMAPASTGTRYNGIWAAIAAIVLVSSVGASVVLLNKKETAEPLKPTQVVSTNSSPFSSPAQVPIKSKPVETESESGLSANTTATTSEDNLQNKLEKPTEKTEKIASSRKIPFNGTTLPNPSGYDPVSPNVDITPEKDTKAQPANNNSDPDPGPYKPTDAKANNETGERPAIIDIRPSKQEQKTQGGSQPRDSSINEATAVIRVARQHFLAGEYALAATAYEKAIKLGASTASANHRLAQCYVNLKRRPEALEAYQNAMAAYQKMIGEGIGDKRLYESYVEECRQAIKLLQ